MNFQPVGPGGQAHELRFADAVGRIVDIAQENRTSAGKFLLDQIEHFIQPLFVIRDPRLGFRESRAVHRSFARLRAAVVVNQIVAAAGHHDEAENVGRLLFQAFP